MIRLKPFALVLLALALAVPAWAEPAPKLTIHPAETMADAGNRMILAAAQAGQRIVAVGEQGVVLLSDDGGAHWRQAKAVPAQSTLTAISFADAKTGWAAGHWGVVIKTEDGGETWRLLRNDLEVDRPIFSILFADKDNGIAVGLWSLILVTRDGGATWREQRPPPPPGATRNDLNLYTVFADAKGSLFATSEGGNVLRSDDRGESWSYLQTGYTGTFWTGTALEDGTLLVGGLRGNIYRSVDDGRTWSAARSSSHSSVTGFAQRADKAVAATALDGVLLTSDDGGVSFTSTQREDREALTALLAIPGGNIVVFSKKGAFQCK